MRKAWWSWAMAASLVLPGCGPKVDSKDLGKVVLEPGKLPGADKTISFPELEKKDTPSPSKPSP